MSASLGALYRHFRAYFGATGADPLPGVVAEAITGAVPVPFTRQEVVTALGRMARSKTTGLALYSADTLRGATDGTLYDMVARLFDFFATRSYPA